MKGSEWLMFCIENRTSKKQKDVMLVKRINKQYEQRLVSEFKEKEKEWFTIIALDITRRHTLSFSMEDDRGKYVCVEYSKKEKRFLFIRYEQDGCWHYIFLKHSTYLTE